MAILRGFPPSNTISPDQPTKRHCCLCGEFWASFPIGLGLDFSADPNYSFLACNECYLEDQGKEPWTFGVNKWKDGFSIYSKVREGHTFQEMTETYIASGKAFKAGTEQRRYHCVHYALEMPAQISRAIEVSFINGWHNDYYKPENVTSIIVNSNVYKILRESEFVIGEKFCPVDDNSFYNEFSKFCYVDDKLFYNEYFWDLICNPNIPEKSDELFLVFKMPLKKESDVTTVDQKLIEAANRALVVLGEIYLRDKEFNTQNLSWSGKEAYKALYESLVENGQGCIDWTLPYYEMKGLI